MPARRAPRVPHDPLATLVGDSPVFRAFKQRVEQCARWDAPVLIEGATGTGKELVARAIHYVGARAGNAFVPVNCGALPDTLVENELFGHQRGAYTGAHAHHLGLVAQAEGGTLFLDEVEALSPRAQATLLRFMQDATYRPLGSPRENRSDVRIVTASNVCLESLAATGAFRADLLYRLKVLNLTMPALRERGDDALLLARHFVHRYARTYALPVRRLHPDMAAWMRRHTWPGNVRELENLIHRAYLLGGDSDLNEPAPAELRAEPTHDPDNLGMAQAKARAVERFERDYLAALMTRTGGNVTQAARIAGKERRSLGRLLKKHGLSSQN
jgi:DNA-binding NtrC family response regulator